MNPQSTHKPRRTRAALRQALKAAHPPSPWEGSSFDTETYQGWARLICTPTESIEIPRGAWRKAFRFLVANGPALTAFNLRFDIEAILKHLPERTLRFLLAAEWANIGQFRVEIVPWKMVRITDTHTERFVELYDIAQFFSSGLDEAAKRFLKDGGKNANELGIDPARLNTDSEAWRDIDRIIKYCQKDAWDTERLTSETAHRFNTLGGSFDRPYSVAYVAADVLTRDVELPRIDPAMLGIADLAFFGARFECIQRGRFADAYAYDIKSAYPSELLDLEEAADGRWVETRRPHKDALHSITECIATVPDDIGPIAPLPHREGKNGPVIYPTGTFKTHVLGRTLERFGEFLSPIRSWSFIPKGEPYRPYKRTVQRLLDFRASTDILLNDAAKRGANSVYGKLLNRYDLKELREVDPGQFDNLAIDDILISPDGTFHITRQSRRGLLYNSLHAGYVTEGCRLRMYDAAIKHPDRVIMIQADGLLMDGPALGKTEAKKPGDLGYVTHGDTVSCGSGLYDIRGQATKTRGVTFGDGRFRSGPKSWFQALRAKPCDCDGKTRPSAVHIENVRPAHLSECLSGSTTVLADGGSDQIRTLGLKDANVFVRFIRHLEVCSDKKRVWPLIPSARSLLKERFASNPIHVEEE